MKNIIKKIFTFQVPTEKENFIIEKEEDSVDYDVRNEEFDEEDKIVSENYNINLEYIKKRFSYPENNDFVIRKLNLKGNIRAFIIFYDGIIDNNYCGNNDIWTFPAYATRDTVIYKGDRIAQFRIVKSQPRIKFVFVDKLKGKNRGGLGSTGR